MENQIDAEEGIRKIRRIVGRWLTPGSNTKARESLQEVVGVLLNTTLPVVTYSIQSDLMSALVDVGVPAEHQWFSQAALDVTAERRRQIETEGWTPEHDDEHASDEIAAYACLYAMPPAARDWDATSSGYGATFGQAMLPEGWGCKLGDRRRELVKAGALILAEIERLDRAAAAAPAELYTATDEARMDVIGQNGNGGEHYEAPAVDADAWIEWVSQEDGTCPVEAGVLVDVRYRDGTVMLGIPALEITPGSHDASKSYWDTDHVQLDIVAYRLSKQP